MTEERFSMSGASKPAVVSGITVVFAVLVIFLMSSSNVASLLLVGMFSVLAVVFFAGLEVCGLALAFVMLADRIHYYAVLREKREIELQIRRQQAAHRHNGMYSYRPRYLHIVRRPPEDMQPNGC